MPPTGYLSSAGIEACLQFLANLYPLICELIELPHRTHEDRLSRAIKIGSSSEEEKRGILFIGGVHAREIVNPDLLVTFAFRLCTAYNNGTGLTFGGKSYSAETIQIIVDSLDIFIFPLVNPDGREYVFSPTGDPWWRKNRNPNPGLPCEGVDLNRNHDFLWSSGIGTSFDSCSQIYKGVGPYSEPETQNVKYIIDSYTNIKCMIDVHSYSELILYPWGDDDNQTSNPAMSFHNPAYDGMRGTLGDTDYREHITGEDQDNFIDMSTNARDDIADVRGRGYTVLEGSNLYPTTATGGDYPYSRHLADGTKEKICSFTLETGREFQPEFAEAWNIIEEVSAGLVQFCINCMCLVEEAARMTLMADKLDTIRSFRDRVLRSTASGRKYIGLLQAHTPELMLLVTKDKKLRGKIVKSLEIAHKMASKKDPGKQKVDGDLLAYAGDLIEHVEKKASKGLKKSIKLVKGDLKLFKERKISDALKTANKTKTKTKK